MADSPVGWGDKTLDGTGTGLERGGDPPEQDAAAKEVAELLHAERFLRQVMSTQEAADVLAAVAERLRERDSCIEMLARREIERCERIAALEAVLNKVRLFFGSGSNEAKIIDAALAGRKS